MRVLKKETLSRNPISLAHYFTRFFHILSGLEHMSCAIGFQTKYLYNGQRNKEDSNSDNLYEKLVSRERFKLAFKQIIYRVFLQCYTILIPIKGPWNSCCESIDPFYKNAFILFKGERGEVKKNEERNNHSKILIITLKNIKIKNK